MLNEADTRVKLIDLKLHENGWQEEMIRRGVHITPGRIVDEERNRRTEKKPGFKATERQHIAKLFQTYVEKALRARGLATRLICREILTLFFVRKEEF